MFTKPTIGAYQHLTAELTTAPVKAEALLPDEMVDRIFSFLPPSEHGNVSSVCKQWNDVSKEERYWKQICVERKWDKSSESENWYACARRHVGLCSAFEVGQILNRQPAITDHVDLTLPPFQPGNRVMNQNVAIYNSGTKHGEEKSTIYIQPEEGSSEDDRTLFSSIFTTETEQYMDGFEEIKHFNIEGIVSAMALQGNILAVYAISGGEGKLHLLNIKNNQRCSYPISGTSTQTRQETIDCFAKGVEEQCSQKQSVAYSNTESMEWRGHKLYLTFRDATNKQQIREFDFSEATRSI